MGLIDNTALNAFWTVRHYTDHLCESLTAEDQCIQSMPDASPAKWHRAHTTWFFEQFILRPNVFDYRPFSEQFSYLFNSYYEAVGARHPRFARGMITRPSSDEVTDYRAHVDAAMAELLAVRTDIGELLALGLQHEQQHQELLVTDMLHGMSQNPLSPAMLPGWTPVPPSEVPDCFVAFPGGVDSVGHTGSGFAFDNEGPRHEVLTQPYKLANRLVRNGAWLEFMSDGGYSTPTLWMSEGWATVLEQGWVAPSVLAASGRWMAAVRPGWRGAARPARPGPTHLVVRG